MARVGLIRRGIEVGREAMTSPLDFTVASIATFMESAVGKVIAPEPAAAMAIILAKIMPATLHVFIRNPFCNQTGHNLVKKIINCRDPVSAHVILEVSPYIEDTVTGSVPISL
jgi:hypothetical protein